MLSREVEEDEQALTVLRDLLEAFGYFAPKSFSNAFNALSASFRVDAYIASRNWAFALP
jgi:hypothetical protein